MALRAGGCRDRRRRGDWRRRSANRSAPLCVAQARHVPSTWRRAGTAGRRWQTAPRTPTRSRSRSAPGRWRPKLPAYWANGMRASRKPACPTTSDQGRPARNEIAVAREPKLAGRRERIDRGDGGDQTDGRRHGLRGAAELKGCDPDGRTRGEHDDRDAPAFEAARAAPHECRRRRRSAHWRRRPTRRLAGRWARQATPRRRHQSDSRCPTAPAPACCGFAARRTAAAGRRSR